MITLGVKGSEDSPCGGLRADRGAAHKKCEAGLGIQTRKERAAKLADCCMWVARPEQIFE